MSDGTSIVDAAHLTYLYSMAAVLSPNRNASIFPHLAVYLEKLDDACRYDWCGYVVNMLLNQLKSTKNTKAGGCTILLPFWLCEHTNLVRPVHKVGFPRFLKWDLNDLEKQHKLLKLTDLEAKFVGPLKLKTSTREQKQFEKLLHYWKEHNIITETQSTDDNQDTQDMPSLENEKIHSLSDPTQTSSDSGENGFNGRLEEEEEKHEREILEKDKVIAMLRAEVEGLRNNINSESTPTLTQVYENPDNLAHIDSIARLAIVSYEKKSLEKEKEYLIDSLSTYNYIKNFHQSDSVDETPVPKHKQVKSYPEQGSMAKRIKERTENEKRRVVVITPQPNTREIIQFMKMKVRAVE
ncbi:hypothetical protein ACS0TY_035820 [Phlomoides rotata]